MQVEYKQSVQEKLQLAFQSQIANCNLHFATEAAVSERVFSVCAFFCENLAVCLLFAIDCRGSMTLLKILT